MKMRQVIALVINWVWIIVIMGTIWTEGTELTVAQAAVLVAGLASSVLIGWLYVRQESATAEPSQEQVQGVLDETQAQLLRIIGDKDEDVTATVKAIFLLASRAAEARYGILEAAEVIGERIEAVVGVDGKKSDG